MLGEVYFVNSTCLLGRRLEEYLGQLASYCGSRQTHDCWRVCSNRLAMGIKKPSSTLLHFFLAYPVIIMVP